MKFAVNIGGKKYPVSVMREPNNSSALSDFVYEGKTYKGNVDQYNGLRFDKANNRYTASSVVIKKKECVTVGVDSVSETDNIETNPNEQPDINGEPSEELIPSEEPNIEVTNTEEFVIEVNEEEEDQEEDQEEEPRQHFTEILQQLQPPKEEPPVNGFKRLNFQPRWSYLFPGSVTFYEGLYEKQKNIWVRQHGSEHLKTAHEIQCKCDGLYLQERSALEFPTWEIHELLIYYEIDSPDFGLLTYLRNFRNLHREMLNAFKSKVALATTAVHPNEEDPVVIIADYLGHADLSIMFSQLVQLYGDSC